MGDSTYVYLTSDGSKDLYPGNRPHAFTNRVQDIQLDPRLTYEVALHSIILPRIFRNIISLHDYIDVFTGEYGPGRTIVGRQHWFRIYPPRDISFVDTREAYNFIDDFLVKGMRENLGREVFSALFPGSDWAYILKWDHEQKKMYTGAGSASDRRQLRRLFRERLSEFNPSQNVIFLKPNRKIRQILGFSEIVDMTVYSPDKNDKLGQYSDIAPRLGRELVDGIMVYTDISAPIRMDGSFVNLLDILSFADKLTRAPSEAVYHEVVCGGDMISTISIMLRDQSGSPIELDEEACVIVALHIRSK